MNDALGEKVKAFETYSRDRIPPDIYFAIRLDGRNFSTFVEKIGYERPYDERFKHTMVNVAEGLVRECNARLAYIQSDEISLIFGKESDMFERRIEKLISTSAAYASCRFAQEANVRDPVVMFDARIITLPNEECVIEYLHWRHSDAIRNALNSWCYWTLRKEGMTKEEASMTLRGKKKNFKIDLLLSRKIDFNTIALWQKEGILLSWEDYTKRGFNPVTRKEEVASRRRIKIDECLLSDQERRTRIQAIFSSNT